MRAAGRVLLVEVSQESPEQIRAPERRALHDSPECERLALFVDGQAVHPADPKLAQRKEK